MIGNKPIKVAILDLYNNEKNQGMRCLKDILNETDCKYQNVSVEYEVFDIRYNHDVPENEYDIYISSGGPGSPFDGEGKRWEKEYFRLLDNIWDFNQNNSARKRHLFFICHSFQIMIRYFQLAEVIKRKSTSFGIMTVHKTEEGKNEQIFEGLSDTFYGADFREWQVVQPNYSKLDELGAKIICLEKERPHIPLERAVMGIRINDEIVGTQFHPEADPASMYYHFRQPERKEQVVSKHGEEKYLNMLALLDVPNAIIKTHAVVLPGFLHNAIETIYPDERPIV